MCGAIYLAAANGSGNLVIVSEGRQDAGLVHAHRHRRFRGVDSVLLGLRGPSEATYS
jgi:hypothetical protein